jgi:hypothetical protein
MLAFHKDRSNLASQHASVNADSEKQGQEEGRACQGCNAFGAVPD